MSSIWAIAAGASLAAVGNWQSRSLFDYTSVTAPHLLGVLVGGMPKSRKVPSPAAKLIDSSEYTYTYEDLSELEAESISENHDGSTDLPPSARALRWVRDLIDRTNGIFPAPEIVARETGTIILLWKSSDGFMSIEIGETEYGAVVTRQGSPSIFRNGDLNNLMDSLPKRRQVSRDRRPVPLSTSGRGLDSLETLGYLSKRASLV